MDETPPEVDDDPAGVWPEHVVRLGAAVRASDGPARRDGLGSIWKLLNLALQKYVRQQSRRLGRLPPQTIREIAADKASDLIARLDSEDWDLAALSPEMLRSFLATVARNGVIDVLRTDRREVLAGSDVENRDVATPRPFTLEQEEAVGREEVAGALAACASTLSSRSRRAWLLRVFYDFSSADIARHPAVMSSPAGVDAMLARCREHLRACMERKGVSMRSLPVGTFVRLWELTERDRTSLTTGEA
ncbi:MAG TPA: RNA polymerase sigma factor [Candidatus Bathyarchaeia archaeon]|jgi:RNA polymerase sigma factor (sigma-70 family)|nr:RNA polymerase sigma factor [Candidatus Bathyarchaeia archaeon]